MDIDQRLTLGIALVALLMAVFAYKEIFEMREFYMFNQGGDAPEPASYDSMIDDMEPADSILPEDDETSVEVM